MSGAVTRPVHHSTSQPGHEPAWGRVREERETRREETNQAEKKGKQDKSRKVRTGVGEEFLQQDRDLPQGVVRWRTLSSILFAGSHSGKRTLGSAS